MKALGLTLIAALAIGCSSTPTSPTSSYDTTTVPAVQDVKPVVHVPGTQVVSIYFNARQLPLVGHYHLTGLPVHLAGVPPVAPWIYLMETGKQGTVSADFPKNYTQIRVWTDAWVDGEGRCWGAVEQYVPLPYVPRQNWINIFLGGNGCS